MMRLVGCLGGGGLLIAAACGVDAEVTSDSTAASSGSGSSGLAGTGGTGTGTESGTRTESDSGTDVAASSSSGEPPPVYDGEPIVVDADGAWHFVPIDGMQCADGRPSGVGVRMVEGARGLALYFKGGGACFNAASCALSTPLMLTGDEAMTANPDGILDFVRGGGPLQDFNVVYFPYCTGDIHAGSRRDVLIPGTDERWDFVGRDNVLAALDRVVPTFQAPEQLLIVGTSAGGLGALVNLPLFVGAWPEVDTVMLDDAGLVFSDAHLAPCLQQQLRDMWGLELAVPPACEACNGANGGGLAELYGYLAEQFPAVTMGLIASREDQVLRRFYGYGKNDCAAVAGLPDLGPDAMSAAVDALVGGGVPDRYATFTVQSDVHVWVTRDQFFTLESGGVALTDWVDDLLAGRAGDVAP